MATLADMRARIADDLARSGLSTQIDKAINRAIIHYEKESFWFQETSGTFNTVASQQIYTSADGLDTDIKEVLYAYITINGTKYQLRQKPIKWIQQNNFDDTEGEPSHFGWLDTSMYLYLIPNAVRAVTYYYRKKYAVLSADGDTNDWLDLAEDLIESRARAWMNTRYIKDYDAARADQIEEGQALDALRTKDALIRPVKVTPWGC